MKIEKGIDINAEFFAGNKQKLVQDNKNKEFRSLQKLINGIQFGKKEERSKKHEVPEESYIENKFLKGDKKCVEKMETLKREIREKNPEFLDLLEYAHEKRRRYTQRFRNKYPELFEDLKNYAKAAGFKDVLITPKRGDRIGISPFFNSIDIEEAYLPTLEKLKDFAPDFLDKGLKHILGNIKEEISGHEREHIKDIALKILHNETEKILKWDKAERIERNVNEAERILIDEIHPLKRKQDFYAEAQRILKHSKNPKEAVNAIAIHEIFLTFLDLGIRSKEDLEIHLDEKATLNNFSKSPDKISGEIKGLFPYLKEDLLNDVIDQENMIIIDLNIKYEKKYGKSSEK